MTTLIRLAGMIEAREGAGLVLIRDSAGRRRRARGQSTLQSVTRERVGREEDEIVLQRRSRGQIESCFGMRQGALRGW